MLNWYLDTYPNKDKREHDQDSELTLFSQSEKHIENKPLLRVSKFQNEFMKSSFLPKYEQKIVRITALGETMTS